MRVVRDTNNVNKLLRTLTKLQRKKIKIGILSKEDGKILTIANVHEFGVTIYVTKKMRAYLHRIGIHLKKETKVINIPERSFIRSGFDENKDDMGNKVSMLISNLINDDIDVDTFYEAIGHYCVGKIQEYLTDLSNPPLSPVTLENREHGGSNPLIDTGKLRDAITFEIVGD